MWAAAQRTLRRRCCPGASPGVWVCHAQRGGAQRQRVRLQRVRLHCSSSEQRSSEAAKQRVACRAGRRTVFGEAHAREAQAQHRLRDGIDLALEDYLRAGQSVSRCAAAVDHKTAAPAGAPRGRLAPGPGPGRRSR
jgi:hypothetical protein